MKHANKNIVIIGGGPCGMEAAYRLKNEGMNVILVEKGPSLGGHLACWDRLFPESIKADDLLDILKNNISDVNCFLNTEIIKMNLRNDAYDIELSNGITVLARAVLFATGFDIFPAEKKEEYGYGIYNKVITNKDLEQYFKTGKDERIPANPKNIGFIHCVGSRDEKIGNRQCSKVCCATAVKQACEIKERFPDANVYSFYMDLRMFGRHYEDLYYKAQHECGVRFIRGRVSEISENKEGKLIVKAEDTLMGKPIKITMDLVVLMAGMKNSEAGIKTAGQLAVLRDDDGFFNSEDSFYNLEKSAYRGIFFAGTCLGPKTIPETINEARSAVLSIKEYVESFAND
ncbi:MAG: FAD-dependent oxidoreductase [Bacteroidales bacterium]|nr:FAD-dependent oxidoreductase [Bacteroidales bacterium]